MPAGPKRDADMEKEAMDWIEALLGDDYKIDRKQPYEKILKNGVVLCHLMNKLTPGSVKKIQTTGGDFKMMENIAAFQKAAKAYGLPDEEIFQTVDLFNARNVQQVTICIHSLGRQTQKHPEYNGPHLGPKIADENVREFTAEQMEAGKHVVNTYQMGYNKGASQAGINMGKQRSVLD